MSISKYVKECSRNSNVSQSCYKKNGTGNKRWLLWDMYCETCTVVQTVGVCAVGLSFPLLSAFCLVGGVCLSIRTRTPPWPLCDVRAPFVISHIFRRCCYLLAAARLHMGRERTAFPTVDIMASYIWVSKKKFFLANTTTHGSTKQSITTKIHKSWHGLWRKRNVNQYALCLEVDQKKQKTVQLTAGRRYVKWRLGFRMSPVTVMARTCSNDWQHGTFMGIPHKVPFWLMAPPGGPPSLHSSALIYSSSLCDLALALPTTSHVKTPRGHIRHYLESRQARASDRNVHKCTNTHQCARGGTTSSHLIHTGPVLEGRWASHCLHSERISHPEGSAARWATGVSVSVKLPSQIWPACVCVFTRHTLVHSLTLPLPIWSLWSLSACQDVHKEINPTGWRHRHINEM